MSRDPLAGLKVTMPSDSARVEAPLDLPAPTSVFASPASQPSKKDKGKWREKSGGEKQATLPPSEPALPAPLPPARVPEFEVSKDCAVSWGGQFVRLKTGTRVSAARFGANAEARLRAAGVELREVVD